LRAEAPVYKLDKFDAWAAQQIVSRFVLYRDKSECLPVEG